MVTVQGQRGAQLCRGETSGVSRLEAILSKKDTGEVSTGRVPRELKSQGSGQAGSAQSVRETGSPPHLGGHAILSGFSRSGETLSKGLHHSFCPDSTSAWA